MRPLTAPASRSLPDSDALRRAALTRSWQRDRRVGRRRLVWRWTLWLLWRYGLPAAAGALLTGATIYAAWRWFGLPSPAPGVVAPAAAPAPTPVAVPHIAPAPVAPRALVLPRLRLDPFPPPAAVPLAASSDPPRPKTQGAEIP